MQRMLASLPLTALLIVCFPLFCHAADATDPVQRSKNSFEIMLGAVYWPDLHDVDMSRATISETDPGRFNAWGFNIELGYHRDTTSWKNLDILLGGDFGLFYNDNESETPVTVFPSGQAGTQEVTSRGLYLTPSARFLFGEPDSWQLVLGAGVGWYLLSLAVQVTSGPLAGLVVDEEEVKNVFGGYVSAGVDFPPFGSSNVRLRLENKVHLADFGDLDNLAPNQGNLTGPTYIFQVGLVFQ